MDREQAAEKLKKIKALAERGVGGEKETAMRMYRELMEKYQIEEAEVLEDLVKIHWFRYSNDLEEDLLTQIFYKVTGSATYKRYIGRSSRRRERGCECTELEAVEIKMLFNFYREELKRELEAFMMAFRHGNNLFPDETARCYKEYDGPEIERTDEERRMMKKAGAYSMFMDKNTPPRALLGEMEEED